MDNYIEGELNNSYWQPKSGTTSNFLDIAEPLDQQNNLWDGLFSPDQGSTNNIFELHNNFSKQSTLISPSKNPDDQNSCENKSTNKAAENSDFIGKQIHDEHEVTATSASTPIPPCESDSNIPTELSLSSKLLQKSPANQNATAFMHSAGTSSCTIDESTTNSLNDSQQSELTVHLDYARLKAEHRKLRRYFENAYENRYKTPPIAETIQRLSRCEPVALDLYQSKKDKMELLDSALELDNWDVVVTVVLFVKRTLDNSIFRQCLFERPAAAKHYITYLKEAGEKQELMDTLFGLGCIAEATLLEFKQACTHKEPRKQLEALRNCFISGFHHPDLANERPHLEEWISLLEAHVKANKPH